MRHRGDEHQDGPSGEQSSGGPPAAPVEPASPPQEVAAPGPELEDAGLAERLDVVPERGDVKG